MSPVQIPIWSQTCPLGFIYGFRAGQSMTSTSCCAKKSSRVTWCVGHGVVLDICKFRPKTDVAQGSILSQSISCYIIWIARGNSIIGRRSASPRGTAKSSTAKWFLQLPPEYNLTATVIKNAKDQKTCSWYFDDNYYIMLTHNARPSQMHENLLIIGIKTLTIARVLTLLIKFACICEIQSWWVHIASNQKFVYNALNGQPPPISEYSHIGRQKCQFATAKTCATGLQANSFV